MILSERAGDLPGAIGRSILYNHPGHRLVVLLGKTCRKTRKIVGLIAGGGHNRVARKRGGHRTGTTIDWAGETGWIRSR
jgi:hypothetical protein